MRLKHISAEPAHLGAAYLPGIDGLRALAVVAVMLYHADLAATPGGFLGVEVFFVISGYLITTLLFAEHTQFGRVRLVSFWLRRARRLLPALFALLIAVVGVTAVFLPGELAGLRPDVLAALGYATNWYLIAQQRSYFEIVGRPPLLQHLWSLAVEEQFYLLWPLLLGLGLRAGRRCMLAATLVGVLLASLLMGLSFQPDLDPSRLYYGTDTRASGLLLGAALALAYRPGRAPMPARRLAGAVLDAAGLAALAALGYCFTQVNEFQSLIYQGGLLGVALAATVVIAAVAHPRARLVPALLSIPPLRWAGLRSYSLYLWHWPVFMLLRPELDIGMAGLPLLVLRFALAALLAELSYRLIETPFRSGAVWRAWQHLAAARGQMRWRLGMRWLASAAVFMGLCLLLGRAVVNAQPPAPPAYLADDAPAGLAAAPVGALAAPAATSAPTPLPNLAVAFAAEAPTLTRAYQPAATAQPATPATSVPAPAPAPTPAGHTTAIGDSVMAGAVEALGTAIEGVEVDAVRGRQAAAVIKNLQARRDAGRLGDLVIIHTGSNGPFSARQFDSIMQLLADTRLVLFVNVKVPRRWEAPNNAVIADGVQRYPNTLMVDWHAASVGRPELFWRDGIHLRPRGAELYANLIAGALRDRLSHLSSR